MSAAIVISRNAQRTLVADVLLASMAGDGVDPADLGSLVDGRDLDGVTEAARYHRVVAWVYRALRDSAGADPAVVDRLRGLHRASSRSHLRVTAALASTAEALDAADVRWLVFKGPVLSEVVYRVPEMRLYRDLDLLVARQDFGTALRALEGAGGVLLDHNWPLIERDGYGELNLVERYGTPLDLHWQLLFSQALRNQFPVPVDQVLERATDVEVRGRTVRTLDATDSLLHLAFHAALNGGDRLIWLKDLEQSARHRPPEWEELVVRARAWRVHLQVALLLARAERTVGAALPPGLLEELAPQRAWRSASAAIDRLFPAVHSRGGGDPARMLARTARDTPLRSSTHLALVLGQRVTRLVRERRWNLAETEEDPSNPESVRFRAGDPGDLDRYLERVRTVG